MPDSPDPELSWRVAEENMYMAYISGEETVLWSLHLVISLAAITVLCRRGLRPIPHSIQLLTVSALLFLTTFQQIRQWNEIAFNIHFNMTQLTRWPWNPFRFRGFLWFQDRVMNWLYRPAALVFLISDAFILWRAWSVWTHRKIFKLIALGLFVASFILSIVVLYMMTVAWDSHLTRNESQLATIALTMITRLVATIFTSGLILYEICSRLPKEMEPVSRWGLPVNEKKAIFYLTESGVLLNVIHFMSTVLFLCPMFFSYRPPLGTTSWLWRTREYLYAFYFYCAVTYPAILVLTRFYGPTLVITRPIFLPADTDEPVPSTEGPVEAYRDEPETEVGNNDQRNVVASV